MNLSFDMAKNAHRSILNRYLNTCSRLHPFLVVCNWIYCRISIDYDMNQEIKNKICPECERSIFGIIDNKYCSDACRNSANNRLNADSNNFVRNVNNTLRKNRRILFESNPSGETKIKLIELFKKGFDMDFYTNCNTTRNGLEYRYCYDQGYVMLDK